MLPEIRTLGESILTTDLNTVIEPTPGDWFEKYLADCNSVLWNRTLTVPKIIRMIVDD